MPVGFPPHPVLWLPWQLPSPRTQACPLPGTARYGAGRPRADPLADYRDRYEALTGQVLAENVRMLSGRHHGGDRLPHTARGPPTGPGHVMTPEIGVRTAPWRNPREIGTRMLASRRTMGVPARGTEATANPGPGCLLKERRVIARRNSSHRRWPKHPRRHGREGFRGGHSTPIAPMAGGRPHVRFRPGVILGKEVKARALPWTRQGHSPWNQPVGEGGQDRRRQVGVARRHLCLRPLWCIMHLK